MVDSPAGRNQGYYRSGPLNADGTVTAWRPWVAVPDWGFWENQGAGITVADLDGDGTPELVVLAVDNPPRQNGGYYSVGWHLEGGRPADGWGPWQAVPDWCFWAGQGAAAAVANLGQAGMPHLAVLTVDNPPGANRGWYRVLEVMTDLDLAPEMGVWRLLENDSVVNPVHAALLRTGSVLFFAGSGNDVERHAALYATAVWHYPAAAYSQPPTPVDLFCCGHPFLSDGRLLASGGTEQYDPFHGLRQAVSFDPHAGPADAGSPSGRTGAWIAEPDMAVGRWYPTLLTLDDGRVLAVSGLDQTSQLNVLPEIYDGVGWSHNQRSPSNWPLYCHLLLLEDGRVFYSGGQYGANNGVRPSIWDLATNTATDIRHRWRPCRREQAKPGSERAPAAGAGPAGHDHGGWAVRHARPDRCYQHHSHHRPVSRQPCGGHSGADGDAANAPVRHVATRPDGAGQRRRHDGGEPRRRHTGGRNLSPRLRWRSRHLGHGSEVPGRAPLSLGSFARARRQSDHRRLEPRTQDRRATN